MDKFLEKYNLPKLNEEETESLNRPITPDEIEMVIKKLSTQKPGISFTGEFYREIKVELTSILHRLFQKLKKMEDSQTRFMKPTSSLSQNQIKT